MYEVNNGLWLQYNILLCPGKLVDAIWHIAKHPPCLHTKKPPRATQGPKGSWSTGRCTRLHCRRWPLGPQDTPRSPVSIHNASLFPLLVCFLTQEKHLLTPRWITLQLYIFWQSEETFYYYPDKWDGAEGWGSGTNQYQICIKSNIRIHLLWWYLGREKGSSWK